MLLRCSGQLRLGPGAVIGLDLGEALGIEPGPLAELLPSGEAGLLAALNQQTATSDPS